MLFKDFLFTFKNIHISFFEKKKIIKLIRVGLSIIYKFLILELYMITTIHNLFLISNLKFSLLTTIIPLLILLVDFARIFCY